MRRLSHPFPGPRIVVVGVTGSGKTTTALKLSRILGIPHVELDSLHWQPGWVMAELDQFRILVKQALCGASWVADGNYGKARDLIWSRATTLVWLDYALPVILAQLTWRTWKRVLTGEELWNGNRESLRNVFFTKDSLFAWALSSFPRRRKTYPEFFASPDYAHLQVIRLRNRGETAKWLDQIKIASGDPGRTVL